LQVAGVQHARGGFSACGGFVARGNNVRTTSPWPLLAADALASLSLSAQRGPGVIGDHHARWNEVALHLLTASF